MAVVSWVLCLLFSSIIVVTASTSHSITCRPVCQTSRCLMKVTRIDKEECKCQLMFKSSVTKLFKYKCEKKSRSVQIIIPRKFKKAGNTTTLALADKQGNLHCFLVEWTQQSKSTSSLTCSRSDQIKSASLIQGEEHYAEPKRKSSTCSLTPIHNSSDCDNWAPTKVFIIPGENGTVTVRWEPFFGSKDVRIRVENEQAISKQWDKIVPNYKLCRKKLNAYNFQNFEPGTYVAMVGELGNQGCGERPLTKSDRITLPLDNPLMVNERQIERKGPETEPSEEENTKTIATIVVGVLAFIATCAVGIAIIIVRRRNSLHGNGLYEGVPGDIEMPEHRVKKYILTASEQSVLSDEIMESLKELVDLENLKIVPVNSLHHIPLVGELRIVLSLQDYRAYDNKDVRFQGNNVIKIMVNYSGKDDESPFLVHVPANVDDPAIRELPNQTREQEQYLELFDLLKLFNPALEKDEYRDFVAKSSRVYNDNIENIFMISGFVHDHHNKTCQELKLCVEQLHKKVSYAFDPDITSVIRADGPDEWAESQLRKADLVIVIVSEVLFKLAMLDKEERSLPENSVLQRCSVFALRQLAKLTTARPKVAFVSVGYESEYIDRLIDVWRLPCDMRYRLFEEENFQHGESSLEVFLSRLSRDTNLVQGATLGNWELLKNVCKMRSIIKDPRWFPKTYGSEMSFGRLMTLSSESVNTTTVIV